MNDQFCTFIDIEDMAKIFHYFFCLQTENSLWSHNQKDIISLFPP